MSCIIYIYIIKNVIMQEFQVNYIDNDMAIVFNILEKSLILIIIR